MIRQKAFTVVELIIVISVIGLLAGMAALGWNGWRASVSQKEVKSDLQQIVVAMDNAKNFGSGYPTSIPSNFQSSSGVTVSYAAGSSTYYCIQAQSTRDTSVQYYVDSSVGSDAQTGSCTGGGGGAGTPAPTITMGTPTYVCDGTNHWASVSLIWNRPASGPTPTSYQIYRTGYSSVVASVAYNGAATQTTSFTSFSISMTKALNLSYYVRATTASGQSNSSNVWSHTYQPNTNGTNPSCNA